MTNKGCVVVAGLGEVGKPVFDLVSQSHNAIGVDIALPGKDVEHIDVLHVCYPFRIGNFVEETARYIERFKPKVTIINSTVAVGTTRRIAERTHTAVVNSPVRGKHARMLHDLQSYTKFVGAITPSDGLLAVRHFESLGLQTKLLVTPEATELAKLTETTYFGVLIAWAQEVERYCDKTGANYDEVTSFYDEINFFPSVKYFPGVIGGHCVMPNIEILKSFTDSKLLDAVESSNRMKIDREAHNESLNETAATIAV